MEKWDVVAAIATLVALFAAIMGPIIKLTRAITRLTDAMENMEKNVVELTDNNRKDHDALWTNAKEQEKRINDHETRIRVMEGDREG